MLRMFALRCAVVAVATFVIMVVSVSCWGHGRALFSTGLSSLPSSRSSVVCSAPRPPRPRQCCCGGCLLSWS